MPGIEFIVPPTMIDELDYIAQKATQRRIRRRHFEQSRTRPLLLMTKPKQFRQRLLQCPGDGQSFVVEHGAATTFNFRDLRPG